MPRQARCGHHQLIFGVPRTGRSRQGPVMSDSDVANLAAIATAEEVSVVVEGNRRVSDNQLPERAELRGYDVNWSLTSRASTRLGSGENSRAHARRITYRGEFRRVGPGTGSRRMRLPVESLTAHASRSLWFPNKRSKQGRNRGQQQSQHAFAPATGGRE